MVQTVKASGFSLRGYPHWLRLSHKMEHIHFMTLIGIPETWPNPRFTFNQRVMCELDTEEIVYGIIIGMRYYPPNLPGSTPPSGWVLDVWMENGSISSVDEALLDSAY